jgi:tetratricopeptide (TPR) repeat protein
MTSRLAPSLGLLGLLLMASPAVAAAAETKADVEMTARTEYAAGRYQQALELYAKLYAETLHPTYLRNVGRCYQNMKQPDQAIASFQEYLRKAQDLAPKQRQEVEGFIAEMEALKRSREESSPRTGPPPGPQAAPPPHEKEPPPHLNLQAPPPSEQEDTASRAPTLVPEGAPRDEETSSPIYGRWWFWAGLAAVAAGAGVAALLLSSNAPQAPSATTTLGTKDIK